MKPYILYLGVLLSTTTTQAQKYITILKDEALN